MDDPQCTKHNTLSILSIRHHTHVRKSGWNIVTFVRLHGSQDSDPTVSRSRKSDMFLRCRAMCRTFGVFPPYLLFKSYITLAGDYARRGRFVCALQPLSIKLTFDVVGQATIADAHPKVCLSNTSTTTCQIEVIKTNLLPVFTVRALRLAVATLSK